MKFDATIGLSLEALAMLIGYPVVEVHATTLVGGDTVFIDVVIDTTREELLSDESIN